MATVGVRRGSTKMIARLAAAARRGTTSSSCPRCCPGDWAASGRGSSWSGSRTELQPMAMMHVGQFRVFVAVVELADAHLARGVALGVVRRPVVDPHHRRLERREHQLAGAPGVLEAAPGAAVVEAIEQRVPLGPSVSRIFLVTPHRARARRPSRCRPTGRPCRGAGSSAARCRCRRGCTCTVAIWPPRVDDSPWFTHAGLVRHDHDVVAPAVLVLDDVVPSPAS